MALVVENPVALLNSKPTSYGTWNYAEVDTNCPELVDGVHRLLGVDEAKSSCNRNDNLQAIRMYRTCHKLADGAPKSPNHEGSLLRFSARSSKGKTKYLERKPQLDSAKHSPLFSSTVRHALDHCEEQQQVNETELSLTEDYLQPSRYQSPFTGHAMDSTGFSRIQKTFPPYSSSPKSLIRKTSPHSEVASPRYSSSHLSVAPFEAFSLRQRVRSRSLSAVRYSSDMFAPQFRHGRADPVEDCLSGAWKSVQRSLGDAVGMEPGWKGSSFQADYWACALPSSLPPSPDRQSPHWNPDKEYQDLLDYTYPLNSKQLRAREKTREYVSSEPFLHDSGIGLDSVSISPNRSFESVTPYDDTLHAVGSNSSLGGMSPSSPQPLYTKRSTEPGYVETDSDQPTPAGRIAFGRSYSTSGLDQSTEFKTPFFKRTLSNSDTSSSVEESEWCTNDDCPSACALHRGVGFIPTTKVLQCKSEWDSDDEYLSLPPRLKELETLAQQLKDVSLTVQRRGHDNEVRDHPSCIGSSGPLAYKYAAGIGGKEFSSDRDESADFVDHGFLYNETHAADVELCSQDDGADGLRQLSSLRYMLEGISATDNKEDGQNQHTQSVEGNESLVQCIKMFCCKLEELIQWLYKVAEVAEKWVPPEPDVKSIQTSLQLYLKFKKDVVEHQTVAENVVKIGEILLRCMASNSPVLKDALALIVKQSEELERQGERLYASVLGAMDTITDHDLRMNSDTQQAVS